MTYQVYPARWLFLTVVCLGSFAEEFTASSYGIVNNVATEYFEMGAYGTDLLGSIGHFCGMVIPLTTLTFRQVMGFRVQIVTATVFSAIGLFAVTLAFIHRTYWLVFCGQVLVGLSSGTFYSMPMVLAALWFPAHKTATIYTVEKCANRAGATFSALIFANVFSNITQTTIYSVSFSKIRATFMGCSGLLCALMSAIAIVVFRYAADYPPTSPSASQYKIKEIQTQSDENSVWSNVKLSLKLWKNKDFVFVTMSRCLGHSVFSLVVLLISSVILKTFPNLSDSYPGWIRVAATTLAALVSISTGMLIDKYRIYKKFAIIALTSVTLCLIGIYFCHLYGNLTGIIVLYPLLMALHAPIGICLVELLNEVAYGTDNIILSVSHTLPLYIAGLTFTSLERLAMETWDETAAILVVIIANTLSLIMTICVKSKYKRSKVDDAAKKFSSNDEKQLLVK